VISPERFPISALPFADLGLIVLGGLVGSPTGDRGIVTGVAVGFATGPIAAFAICRARGFSVAMSLGSLVLVGLVSATLATLGFFLMLAASGPID
jgi:hypothetical protein